MQKQASEGPASFVVEGNIGAGKSTFLSLIKQHLDLTIMYEPHHAWQHVGGEHNVLQAFYDDTTRWAYTFQSYAFVSRVRAQQEHAKLHPHATHIIERSVWSDRYCFAKNCHELGYMNALEWKLYQEWFSWLMSNYVVLPKGFIYLQADPAVCYKRLQKRNRQEEVAVQIDYLQALHEKHERWLISHENIDDSLGNIPVLVIDANQDFEHDLTAQRAVIQQVNDFVFQHTMRHNTQTLQHQLQR